MRQRQKIQSESSGAELVMVSRKDRIDEEFYALFPNLRPKSREEREAEARARIDAENERRARLTPKEREAEDRQAAKDRERWSREGKLRERRSYDASGAKAGRRAGEAVDLSAGRNHVKETAKNQIGN
jgi:hypothetical protein